MWQHPFFPHSGTCTLLFPQWGKFKLYFHHCGKYHNIISILWKLSTFLLQHYLNYSTGEVLLAHFSLSTLSMEHFIQLTLHIGEHKLFYFQFCGKFWTILSVYLKVYIMISTMLEIQIVLTTLLLLWQGAFPTVKTISVSSTKLSFFLISNNLHC